jgi:hypothetical protein
MGYKHIARGARVKKEVNEMINEIALLTNADTIQKVMLRKLMRKHLVKVVKVAVFEKLENLDIDLFGEK